MDGWRGVLLAAALLLIGAAFGSVAAGGSFTGGQREAIGRFQVAGGVGEVVRLDTVTGEIRTYAVTNRDDDLPRLALKVLAVSRD